MSIKYRQIYFSILIAIGLLFLLFSFVEASTPHKSIIPSSINNLSSDQLRKIHPDLVKILRKSSEINQIPIIIERQRSLDPLQRLGRSYSSKDKLTKRQEVLNVLKITAESESKSLLMFLNNAQQRGIARNIRSFWVSPIISLSASSELVIQLASRSDVYQIRIDQRIVLEAETPKLISNNQGSIDFPFNLRMINLEWAQDVLNLDGQGVVVANLDTGVDWQHPALIQKYRGYNPHAPATHYGNWFVTTDEPYTYPGDGHGHGTHTMGTIVGDDGEDNRIGVAPGAKWIAVKLFTNQGYTYESWIHAAFEWVIAPEGEPTLAPDIINNSWGSNVGSDSRYQADIQALRAAGILPVFSAGNNGPSLGTISSPASYPESFAVGALDIDKQVANFSSRGPSVWHEIKPEVAAPGVDILSAFPGGGYAIADGTSQAAPHVSGIAALLLQADPTLTPDQLEEILQQTAEPLEPVIPNNNSGMGLVNAFAAGLQVTQSGIISGYVKSSIGNSISYPLITIVSLDPETLNQTISVTGNISGTYNIALLPGFYDISASAFGFETQIEHLIQVISETVTTIDFLLDAEPTAIIYGQVTDLITGTPLSATLRVENTYASVQTDPISGEFSFEVPSGEWQINVTSEAHRVDHFTETVTAGNSYMHNIALEPVPHILLIDSGRWYYDSHINIYQTALDNLSFPYDLLPIRNPFGAGGQPSDLPTLEDLTDYELIIWSAPRDSPGLIGMNDVLTNFLTLQGDLLISGQDVAYLDGSLSSGWQAQEYLTKYIGVWFDNEGNLNDLSGVKDSPLAEITVSLNTLDSSQNQLHPDSGIIYDPTKSQASLYWSDGKIGAVTSQYCQPYRAAWIGFGFEGSGPAENREELLKSLIEWTTIDGPQSKLLTKHNNDILIGAPGGVISSTFTIYNLGISTDTYSLQIQPGLWEASIENPDGSVFNNQSLISIPSCSHEIFTYTINIPSDTLRNQYDGFQVYIQSQSDINITDVITLSSKSPAPVLLVDDERWYNHEDKYISVLQNLSLPYDYIETKGDYTPLTNTLMHYPLILWTTGYDWYAPLTAADELRLSYFLDNHGRLVLASQDLLNIRENSDFVRQRLGVNSAILEITPTLAIPIPENILSIIPRTWSLVYPFKNWSDAIVPTNTASSVLMDGTYNNIGIVNSSPNWRTAFYSFPPETLDTEPIKTLLGKSLLWVSTFGNSHLKSPPAAAENTQFPITLTLGLAESDPQTDLLVKVPLIPETTFVTGTISGPWNYEASSNQLIWSGALTPGITVTLNADLRLIEDIPDGKTLSLIAYFYDSKGILVTDECEILIDAPWLGLEKSLSPNFAQVDDTIFFTITVDNPSAYPTDANLSEVLSEGLLLISDSIEKDTGVTTLNPQGFDWQVTLTPFTREQLFYQAAVNLLHTGSKLINKSNLVYPFGDRFAWGIVNVPTIFYFPWIVR